MKDAQIATLEKVAVALKHLPIMEYELYAEYMAVLNDVKARRLKQKQNYYEKVDYYKRVSKKWKQDNKERHVKHQEDFVERKRAKKTTDAQEDTE